MLYNVVYEINIEADSPLEAAKQVQDIFTNEDGDGYKPQLYVQENEDERNKLFSVDLQEADEDAVLDVEYYHPMINEYCKPAKRK